MDEWTEILDNGGQINSIYMDFMKAFDKVPHKRLVKKLYRYGISEQVIGWIEEFLKDRAQKVTVNGSESARQSVTSGIPQGSVLGPTLFVLYINDMPECVHASTYLFADDTKIYKQTRNISDVESLQKDLDSLQKWSDTKKFHPNKCKVMNVMSSNSSKTDTAQYHLYDNQGNKVILEKSEAEKDIRDTCNNR
jgi:hypothetical protein